MRNIALILCVGAALGARVFAAPVTPIVVTGFNHDVVVEAGAPATATGVTTATMDGGTGNTGGTWYEQGYNTAAPLTGLPARGTAIISASASDHSYQFPSSYGPGNGAAGTTNDAFVVGHGTGTPTITLAIPAAYSTISLLGAAGFGPNTVNFTIQFTDASTQTGSLTVGDWFNGTAAYVTNGRVTVGSGSFDNVNAGNPRLYSYDILLGSTVPIQSIALSSASASSTAAFFALSGTAIPEPSSLALCGLGAGMGMLLLRRRRAGR